MKRIVLLFAALLVAGCGEKSTGDPKIDQALKEAVERDSLEERDDLYYKINESEPYSGWAKEMYDSGQVKVLAQFKDGKLNGRATAWHENGQKQDEGTFKDAFAHGPYTTWHENGQKRSEATYKDGELDGLRTRWHENGQKMFEGTYKKGKKVSEKYWNSKGEEVETREEADVERLVKKAVEFDSLEERDDLHYQTNESKPYSGWAKVMYDSGQVAVLGRFKDGKLDGLWTDWHENGQKMVGMIYKDGEVDGLFTMWHENGQKEEERTYKDGKPADGLHTQWHADGQKRAEVTFRDGEEVSAKYWNSKGEEVETPEAAEE